jgi:hypothetical protein
MKIINFNSLLRAAIFLAICISFSTFAGDSIKDGFQKTKLDNFTESACPADDFDGFFKIFSNDEKIQKIYTHPLVTSMWIEVSGVPEPTPFLKTYKKTQLEFPLMPNEKERKERQLTFHSLGNESASVALVSENSGYRIRFIFIRTSCWYLIGIEDTSI